MRTVSPNEVTFTGSKYLELGHLHFHDNIAHPTMDARCECTLSTTPGLLRIFEEIWAAVFLGELSVVCEIMVWVFC